MMKKQLFSLMFLLLPFLGVSQDFMIWQKPTAPNPPLGRYVLLDDGSGNYTKATLQSIIEQVNVPEAEGDGFVSGLNWSSVSKTLTVFQTGANQQAVTLTGLDYTLPAGTASVRGGFRLGTGLTVTNGDVLNVASTSYTLPTATTLTKGGIRIGTGVSMNSDVLSVPIASASTRGSVRIGTGLSMSGEVLSLPAATASARGGIRVGSGLIISSGDIVSVDPTLADYNLPAATASTRGGIRLGTGFTVSNGDVVSVAPSGYTLPTASATTLGGIRVGSGLSISSGVLSVTAGSTYTLPAATASVRGGIRVGSGLSISGDVLSATATAYNLPAATASVRGGIRVGQNLAVSGDVLRANMPQFSKQSYSSFSGVGINRSTYTSLGSRTFTLSGTNLVHVKATTRAGVSAVHIRYRLYINGSIVEEQTLANSFDESTDNIISLNEWQVVTGNITVSVDAKTNAGLNSPVIFLDNVEIMVLPIL